MNSRCQPAVSEQYQQQQETDSESCKKLDIEALQDDLALDVLINQIEFVRILAGAADIADFNRRIVTVLESLGFSDYVVASKSISGAANIPFSSMPKELKEAYQAERFSRYDMVMDYMETGSLEPVYLSAIGEVVERASLITQTFKKNLEILALYKRFEVNDAYLLPVKTNRHKGEDKTLFAVISKGTSREEFRQMVERCKPILRLLADAVNFIGETKFYPRKSRQPINPRPLRLLTTMAKQDLTLAQAADVLCISIDTANKHMALAKKALGTSSQANAVYLALKQGLIEFS